MYSPAEENVFGLIKFGALDRIEDMRRRGTIYMNTVGYFKRLETNAAQGDEDEGLSFMYQASRGVSVQVKVGEKFEPLKGVTGQIKMWHDNPEARNLLCLFAITENSFPHLADPKLRDFGDAALVFLSGDAFLRRVRKNLEERGISHRSKLVKYINRDQHHGEMGPFRKIDGYAYQSEFRLMADANVNGPLKFEIGDISDITIVLRTEEVSKMLRLVPDVNNL